MLLPGEGSGGCAGGQRAAPSHVFEFLFYMAAVLFAKAEVDFWIMETGLGGRLDATNAVEHPLISVITSISLDHTQYLGSTIREIAGEKAGIIKEGVTVIYDANNREAAQVINAQAKRLKAKAVPFAARTFRKGITEKAG